MSPDYIAGLFDGEGCFHIHRVKGRPGITVREWRFQGYASIVLREAWLLDAIQLYLGYGSSKLNKKATTNHAAYHRLLFSGRCLSQFCNDIGPLLYIKRNQSILMIEVCLMKKLRGNRPISDFDYARELHIWEEMTKLNMKGPKRS